MLLFVTVMAWVMIVLCSLRIVLVIIDANQHKSQIELLREAGVDLIANAVRMPSFIILVSTVWLLVSYFTQGNL